MGMKWGIWNPETRARYLGLKKHKTSQEIKEYSRNAKKANDIYKTLTDEEKKHLTANPYDDNPHFDKVYEKQKDYKSAAFSLIKEVKDVPVSAIDVFDQGNGVGAIAVMVRNGEQYRGKGYAKESVKRALDWFEQNPDILQLDWVTFSDNYGSQKLAEKMGFELNKKKSDDKSKVYSIRKNK